MLLTESDQALVVIVNISICFLVQIVPLDGVDGVGLVVAVLVEATLNRLGTEDFLAGLEEGDTLRGHVEGNAQLVHLDLGSLVSTAGQGDVVIQGVVVVAGDVVDGLRGRGAPGGHTLEAGIQVAGGSAAAGDPTLGNTTEGVALDQVTDGIAEVSEVGGLGSVGLGSQSKTGLGQLGVQGPAFAVEDGVRMLCADSLNDLVDGGGVDQTDQVETEAVDVVLIGPVVDGVNDVLLNHGTLGSNVIAAAGAVGAGTGEVAGNDHVEAELVGLVNVVVNNVHDDRQTGIVHALDHLLEFLNTDFAVVGIGGVGTLGGVVVHGIVTPVELLLLVQLGLVNTAVVVNRQQVNMGNTQVDDVVQTGGLAFGVDSTGLDNAQILTNILDAGGSIAGQIAHMQLVDDSVVRLLASVGVLIVGPTLGIGSSQVDDHGTLTVDTGGAAVGIGSFQNGSVGGDGVGVVGAVHVAGQLTDPGTVDILGHGLGTDGQLLSGDITVGVQVHINADSGGSPNTQSGLLSSVSSTQVIAGVGVLSLELGAGVEVRHGDSSVVAFEGNVVTTLNVQGLSQSQVVVGVNILNSANSNSAVVVGDLEGFGSDIVLDIAGDLHDDLRIAIGVLFLVGSRSDHNASYDIVAFHNLVTLDARFDIDINGTGQNTGQLNELVLFNVLCDPVAKTDNVAQLHGAGVQLDLRNHLTVDFLELIGGLKSSAGDGCIVPEPHFPAFVLAVFTVIVQSQGDCAFSGHCRNCTADEGSDHYQSQQQGDNTLFHDFSFHFCRKIFSVLAYRRTVQIIP